MKDRIRKILSLEEKKRKWGAQTRFALKVGASQGQIGDWLAGRSEPGEPFRNKICLTYGSNRDWLDTGEGLMLVGPQDEKETSHGGNVSSDWKDGYKQGWADGRAALFEEQRQERALKKSTEGDGLSNVA